ncbi:MAG TPA: hypothetical protein VJ246_02030 [Patescibacteria group bacterium]|nr:hypothetical protein [Patescibacteria group bacterium]
MMQSFHQTIRPDSTISLPFSVENIYQNDADVLLWLTNPQPMSIFQLAAPNLTVDIKTDDELHTQFFGQTTLSDWFANGPAKLGTLSKGQLKNYSLTVRSSSLQDKLQREKVTFDFAVELKEVEKEINVAQTTVKTIPSRITLITPPISSSSVSSAPPALSTVTPSILGVSTQSAQQNISVTTQKSFIPTSTHLFLLFLIILACITLLLARMVRRQP